MKSIFLLIVVSVVGVGICFATPAHILHKDRTSVTIKESGDTYQLYATFAESKTKKVQGYMDDNLTRHSDFSFKNAQLDAKLTLDNKITFYIKSSPGKLVLKFTKSSNTTEAFAKFKKMCEGIKDVLGEE